MNDLKCLENIIGLSRTECACFDTGKPSDAEITKSGLYLDELQGLDLNLIGSDIECGEGNVWEKMEKAIEISKNTFRTDILAAITEFASARRKPFNGKIGEVRKRTVLMAANNFIGEIIQGCNIKGAEFTLRGISTHMDTTTTFDIYIYNNIQDDPILQIPNIEATANMVTPNILTPNENLTFPLYTEECDSLEYYIVYVPSGFNPYDNKVSCGCSRKQPWEQWFDVQGISGDDISTIELRENLPRNEFANGLILDLVINCNTQNLICGGENEDLDYENDPVSRVTAKAIQYKAGEVLINYILSSGNINRSKMMSKEALYGKRNHYASEYGSRINWLSENIDIKGNDCLGSNDGRMNRASILS
jgi:hypothetical protein